ncbi:MAG TPA: hypothetical protein VLZ81_03675, partial [Blastocatellia bacterium]|nr:hypothetical protein [Blastocatellia bacterium]
MSLQTILDSDDLPALVDKVNGNFQYFADLLNPILASGTGPQGAQGAQGPQGAAGGPQGAQGPQGPQ